MLPLFQRRATDLRAFVLAQDVIYVGGGNTVNLLAVWRAHGLDTILREAYMQGVVLCGISAGSLCWFECGVTDSFGPTLAVFARRSKSAGRQQSPPLRRRVAAPTDVPPPRR